MEKLIGELKKQIPMIGGEILFNFAMTFDKSRNQITLTFLNGTMENPVVVTPTFELVP